MCSCVRVGSGKMGARGQLALKARMQLLCVHVSWKCTVTRTVRASDCFGLKVWEVAFVRIKPTETPTNYECRDSTCLWWFFSIMWAYWLVTIITLFLIIRTFLFSSLLRNGRSNCKIAIATKLKLNMWISCTLPGKASCNKHGSQCGIWLPDSTLVSSELICW